MKALAILGTRPEAIKLAPVIRSLERADGDTVSVCVTSQHRELLDQALRAFGIRPDHDLDLMEPAQSLNRVLSRALPALERVIGEEEPDVVLVQGDTTSALAGALAAFHLRVPVGHVEAGLRSGDPASPFPEEANRRMITALATLHFAPTEGAARHLRREGVPGPAIQVTGNTVVDALQWILRRTDRSRRATPIAPGRRVVLVTLHRRETLGEPLRGLCRGLRRVARRHPGDAEIRFPVHRNPGVRRVAIPALRREPNVRLLRPLGYPAFVRWLERADLVVTDSGGVQEEAAALGKRVLVAREVTERPEVIESGCGRLVGTDPARFENAVESALAALPGGPTGRPSQVFGDGRASERILATLRGLAQREPEAIASAV